MSHPSKQEIGWGVILRINLRMAAGLIAIFYGWFCWQMASPEWWGFWLMSVLAYAGGGLQVLVAVAQAVQLIIRLRRWRRFERMGALPRADHMVQDHDFRTGGRSS